MASETISIQVDAETARIYEAAPAEERRKMELLLGLRLRDLATSQTKSLSTVMDEIGRNAEARGLTPTLLESLLDGE